MSLRTVVVGGGAAGIGAAGGVKAASPANDVVVYTEYEDVGYSPCGIPYVHGRRSRPSTCSSWPRRRPTSRRVSTSATRRGSTRSTYGARWSMSPARARSDWDRLVIATGFDYADPGVPGGHLEGLYYVKNIRRAMEWDKVLDTIRPAVVVHATPLGLEMTTALAHRGIDTHLVDPQPWALADMVDPDIIAPVQDSWVEMGSTCTSTPRSRPSTASTSSPASETSGGDHRRRPGGRLHAQAAQRHPRREGRPEGGADGWPHRRRADGHVGRGRVRGR